MHKTMRILKKKNQNASVSKLLHWRVFNCVGLLCVYFRGKDDMKTARLSTQSAVATVRGTDFGRTTKCAQPRAENERNATRVRRISSRVHSTHQLLLVLNFKTHQSQILFCHSRRRRTTSHFCFCAVQIFEQQTEKCYFARRDTNI